MPSRPHPEDFVPNEPFVLINVRRNVPTDDLSERYPSDVYAAVHGWWRLNPGVLLGSTGFLVLARNTERILGVYRVRHWVQQPTDNSPNPRWGFVGDPAELSAQLRYFGKRVPSRYRTSRNPIRFVEDLSALE